MAWLISAFAENVFPEKKRKLLVETTFSCDKHACLFFGVAATQSPILDMIDGAASKIAKQAT